MYQHYQWLLLHGKPLVAFCVCLHYCNLFKHVLLQNCFQQLISLNIIIILSNKCRTDIMDGNNFILFSANIQFFHTLTSSSLALSTVETISLMKIDYSPRHSCRTIRIRLTLWQLFDVSFRVYSVHKTRQYPHWKR